MRSLGREACDLAADDVAVQAKEGHPVHGRDVPGSVWAAAGTEELDLAVVGNLPSERGTERVCRLRTRARAPTHDCKLYVLHISKTLRMQL